MTSTQLALAKALAMKLQGIKIKGVRLKGGVLEKTTSTPLPLRKGKHAQAARKIKAWKAKSK